MICQINPIIVCTVLSCFFLELSNPLSSGAAGTVIYKVRLPATSGIKSGASVRWGFHRISGTYFRVQSESFSHAVFLLYKPDIVLPLVISNPDVNSATDNESPLPSQALLSGNRVIVADGVLRDGAVVKILAIFSIFCFHQFEENNGWRSQIDPINKCCCCCCCCCCCWCC